MSNTASVRRILAEMKRLQETAPNRWDQDLDAARAAQASGSRSPVDFGKYDARRGFPGAPELTKPVQMIDDVSTLFQIVAGVCARAGVVCQLTGFIKGGCIVQIQITSGAYLGVTNIQSVFAAITAALRERAPCAVADVLEIVGPDMFVNAPGAGHKGRASIRIRSRIGGDVI
jgi:hypothetical protein